MILLIFLFKQPPITTDDLANKFHEFIESKEDFNNKQKIEREKSKPIAVKSDPNENLPKLQNEKEPAKPENKDDTLNFSDMSHSLNFDDKSKNLTSLFHEFIERSMNGDLSLLGKNMPLGKYLKFFN